MVISFTPCLTMSFTGRAESGMLQSSQTSCKSMVAMISSVIPLQAIASHAIDNGWMIYGLPSLRVCSLCASRANSNARLDCS